MSAAISTNVYPTEPPTLAGVYGKAWNWTGKQKWDGVPHSQVDMWIINAPYAHPVWANYVLSLIHLRNVDGLEPAHISLPGATHEFYLYALNPDGMFSNDGNPRVLTPINFSAQFIAEDDEAAKLLMRRTVQDVIDGLLNPDTDNTQSWIRRFNDSCLKREYK